MMGISVAYLKKLSTPTPIIESGVRLYSLAEVKYEADTRKLDDEFRPSKIRITGEAVVKFHRLCAWFVRTQGDIAPVDLVRFAKQYANE